MYMVVAIFLPGPKLQRERPEKFRPGERGCEPRPQHAGVMLHQLSCQANWESLCESIKNPWIMDIEINIDMDV